MRKRIAVAMFASALLSCVDQPEIPGVGSFQFSAQGADLFRGTAKIHVSVTDEFGFNAPIEVTLADAPAGLTADPLRIPPGGTGGDLVLHGEGTLILDQWIHVTATAGSIVQTVPAWVTSGFDTGSLDAGFGQSGIATISTSGSCGGLALASGGGLVVGIYKGNSGPGSVVRLTANGRPDATFGQNGIATLAGDAGGPRDVAVAADGSVLVAGDQISGATTDTRLWKLGSGGTPDATFGTGGFAEPVANGVYDLSFNGEKAYVIGTRNRAPFMARVDDHGSLDTQLGSGGIVHLLVLGAGRAALSDGSGWLVAGTAGAFSNSSLRGLLEILSIDGEEGPVVTDMGDVISQYSAPLAQRGEMFAVFNDIALSVDQQKSFIQKLRPDLTPDPSFAADVDADSVILPVAVQADGKLLVVKNPGSGGLEHVVRLNPNGTIDPSVRISVGKLAKDFLPDGARLDCGPVVDAQGRLILGYDGFAGGGIRLVGISL